MMVPLTTDPSSNVRNFESIKVSSSAVAVIILVMLVKVKFLGLFLSICHCVSGGVAPSSPADTGRQSAERKKIRGKTY